LLALSGLLPFALFAHSTGGAFVWDDTFFIQHNRYLLDWKELPQMFLRGMMAGATGADSNFYRPLQLVSHFVDVQLFGVFPVWHHLQSILWACAGAMLLFQLLARLTNAGQEVAALLAAFFASSLWAAHPLQALAVPYLSGRGDLMMLSFTIGAALAWPKNRWLALIFCVCAMLSKESGMLSPLFVWLFAPERGSWKRFWPLAAAVAAYLALRLTVLNFHDTLNFYGQKNLLTENYSYRLFTYLSTVAKGWELIVFPIDMHHGRGWPIFPSLNAGWVLAGLGILAAMAAAAFFSRKRWPLVAAGAAWFVAATLPTSNLIALINAIFYDHWMILPALAVPFALLAPWRWLLVRFHWGLVATAWLAVFLPLSTFTWQQVAYWRSPEALYERILHFEPKNHAILNNLGMLHADNMDLEGAIEHYRKSLALEETAAARNNLGRAYLSLGNHKEAVEELSRAAQLDPRMPQVLAGLGLAQLLQGDCMAAQASFEKALAILPDKQTEAALAMAKQCAERPR